ncbi:hypothetical protein [Lutimonas sp.]|uniref:hypothetical protein n=1 Tax=Lutimonas sp. TaxID=1872403 RepID=UPI003D9AE248
MDKRNKNIDKTKKSNSPDFKVPDGYFENFESRLFEKISNTDTDKKTTHLKNISIFRNEGSSGLKKEHGFKVPEGYFENTDLNFNKEDPKTYSPKVRKLRLISLSIAASILLFFGIKYFNSGETSLYPDQVTLQNDEIADWVADDLVYFDTYEIAEAFDDIELEQNIYAEDAVNYYLDFVDIESLILEN